jgi:hypothetical protein
LLESHTRFAFLFWFFFFFSYSSSPLFFCFLPKRLGLKVPWFFKQVPRLTSFHKPCVRLCCCCVCCCCCYSQCMCEFKRRMMKWKDASLFICCFQFKGHLFNSSTVFSICSRSPIFETLKIFLPRTYEISQEELLMFLPHNPSFTCHKTDLPFTPT